MNTNKLLPIKSDIPLEVKRAIDNYQERRILGWIDIGVYQGDEKYSNLSQIYGAVKFTRTGWEGEKNVKRLVTAAINKLSNHNVKNIDRGMIVKMNSLFDKHEIWDYPRDIKHIDFRDFFIDFLETF
jgi:hypothetical protein